MRPIPGDVMQTIVRDGRTEAGRLQIWMTPHGFLKAAAANKVSVTPARFEGHAVQAVSFDVGGRTLTAYISDRTL